MTVCMKHPGVSMTLLISSLLSATWSCSCSLPFTLVVDDVVVMVVTGIVVLAGVLQVAVAAWVMTSVPLRAAVRCVDCRMMLKVKGGMASVCMWCMKKTKGPFLSFQFVLNQGGSGTGAKPHLNN